MKDSSHARVFNVDKWNQNGYRLVKNGTLSRHGAGRPIVNHTCPLEIFAQVDEVDK
jgi:hypothetical protein